MVQKIKEYKLLALFLRVQVLKALNKNIIGF